MVDDARYGVPAASLSCDHGHSGSRQGTQLRRYRRIGHGPSVAGRQDRGSRLARAATDSLAAGQLQVEIHGGPETAV